MIGSRRRAIRSSIELQEHEGACCQWPFELCCFGFKKLWQIKVEAGKASSSQTTGKKEERSSRQTEESQ